MAASALFSDAPAPALLGVERSAEGRRWQTRCENERLALALAQTLDLPDIVARTLAGRGVTPDRAAFYLNPTLRESLPDPSRFADMDRAAERLADALERGETLGVFGDYDVDGATASALLRLYWEAAGGRAAVHIPDRRREGYGPTAAALAQLARRGASVVATVDCGATACEALGAAADAGLDVIVVDHHQLGAELPRCHALIDPHRLDDRSGEDALAAVGLTFVLLVAVNRCLRARGRFAAGGAPDLFRFLDLVALGTVCDVVPLSGLNRAFVRQGLKVMARRGNPGLAALADTARLDSAPDAWRLGFVLGPRINAGGRVGEAALGHRLLCARSREDALPIAMQLEKLNAERREIEKETLAAAEERAERAMAEDPAALTVAGEGWNPGVIGLVAGRLAECYRRPAAAFAIEGAEAKGSARSVPGFDVGAAVAAAREAGLAAAGGGHEMAAGATLRADTGSIGESVAAFARFLRDRAAASGAADRPAVLPIDGALSPGGATPALMDALEAAEPFGAGNPEPRFAVPACRVEYADIVGGDHVRCRLASLGGERVKAIAFRAANRAAGRSLLAARGGALHVAGHLRRDLWRGRDGVQLVVEDTAAAQ